MTLSTASGGSHERAAWLRAFHDAHEQARTLVCFPHAGGTAGQYFPLSAALAPDIRVLAVQYPGRQDRCSEPAFEDVALLADEIARLLAEPRPASSPVLFGHSLGALVAFETAARLEHRYGAAPAGLIVSGMQAPYRRTASRLTGDSEDAALEALLGLGGTDPAITGHPELRAVILPALRSDFRAAAAYRPGSSPSLLSCPVTAWTGRDDEFTHGDDIHAWAEHTTAGFHTRDFAGDHFYLNGFPPLIVEAVRTAVTRTTGPLERARTRTDT
ncbi:thioesterase [Streptomyces viridochromogenes DSM 40736]|uniref:Thioesterase n=1 Tax=Streptomyces viridochromogenes (strain DSM 40736 / JCM 4977 / BCRC 1201 / Tue 494) TaxID=591159 RepID=D9XF00_STRVT|nr:alpha/beta fold hydrolase [Streptomyces viridochromogenes]EFL30479.1 thioesterase [Streptomyces viridochromogenes DSM 40736]